MKKSKIDIKTITLVAILSAIAVILSYVDTIVSKAIFPLVPIKIGISNVVIIYAIYRLGFLKSSLVVLIKSLLGSLILGSYTTFIIGFTGSLLSFLSMQLIYHLWKDKISIIGISIVGGMMHILGQLFITSIMYQMKDIIIYYGWILLIVSFVSSIIMGIIGKKIIDYNEVMKNKE